MAAKNDAPLCVQGLCKYYDGFRLEDVSFSLEKGAITGLIGRNGAGKTTTLSSILSLIHPSAGSIAFWGWTMKDHADEVKQKIGFVSAGMSYYTLKKLKAITKVCASFYPGWDENAYRQYMARFQLDENKTPAALSNGMKIKYALALALSHGAELLILDEPTSGLDPVSREELIEIFLRLRGEGKTILFSTHITSDLEKCANRILFIRRGRIFRDAPYHEFAASYRLAAYAGDAPREIKARALGICPVRDGCTVLLPEACAPQDARIPTLDEIMIHLEKEEQA